MAAPRRVYNRDEERKLRNNAYINGNVVPKPQYDEPLPEEKKIRRKQQKPEEQVNTDPLLNLRKGIDFWAMAMLCIAMAICAYTAIGYLSIEAKNQELNKQINQLTSQYTALSDSNTNRMDAIVTDTNLNDIFDYAVGRLGMVYPNDNQVIQFAYEDDGYVRQYGDIPELNEETSIALENVLNRLFAN